MRSAEYLNARWVKNYNAAQLRLYLKEQAVAYLGGSCKVCGYDKCLAAMEFHHRDPREKDFVISNKMCWASIEPELDKCVLLCSNCHRETHAGLHPSLLDRAGHEDEADAYELLSATSA